MYLQCRYADPASQVPLLPARWLAQLPAGSRIRYHPCKDIVRSFP